MSRTRVSRGLVAAVGVVIVLGAVAYLHNTNKSRANDKSKNPAPVALAPVNNAAQGTAAAPKPAQTVTPAAPANHNGQIALPGNGHTLITQTPGSDTAAKSPAQPAETHAAPAEVKSTATQTPGPIASAKPIIPVAAAETPAAPVRPGTALADGKARIDAGDLLTGRRILNDALQSGQLSEAEVQQARQMIAVANDVLIFSPRRITGDPYVSSYTVRSGDRLIKLAANWDVTWDFIKRINNISDERRIRANQTLKVVKGPFHAVVSKSKFTLDIYLGAPGEKGSMYVRTFPVGLGRHGSTPTGTWMVAPQGKLKNPKWWGVEGEPAREAGDPLNPLGKFWIGLQGTEGDAVGKEGFGIHGTIEPDSIGKETSHGCIRLINENVEQVYQMLVDGKSTIIVKD